MSPAMHSFKTIFFPFVVGYRGSWLQPCCLRHLTAQDRLRRDAMPRIG